MPAHPTNWQARYDQVAVLGFDLKRQDDAVAALEALEIPAEQNTNIPDIGFFSDNIRGG